MTVRELLNMDALAGFRLAAGQGGLDNMIRTVNILDYEYDGGAAAVEDLPANKFEPGSIVLSSLLFARGGAESLLPAFQRLHADGVGAVAVKTVIYAELPREVLDYADRAAMPLLLFGSEDGYFEDLIDTILGTIRSYDTFEILEKNVRMLAEQPLSQSNTLSLVERLCPRLPAAYRCVCVSPRIPLRIEEYYSMYSRFRETAGEERTVLPYDGDILLLEPAGGRGPLILPGGAPPEGYWIGVGSPYQKDSQIRYAIQEAFCSVKEAADRKIPVVEFEKMGIRKLTRPLDQNYWLRRFSESMLQPVIDYDRENGTNLIETLLCYIRRGGDLPAAAEEMNLHKNSVRYRLDRIRALTRSEHQPDMAFWSNLYLAAQVYFEKEL